MFMVVILCKKTMLKRGWQPSCECSYASSTATGSLLPCFFFRGQGLSVAIRRPVLVNTLVLAQNWKICMMNSYVRQFSVMEFVYDGLRSKHNVWREQTDTWASGMKTK
jgi:hypothetical protein